MKIGVVDSGAGGLSILNAVHKRIPSLDLIYLADEAFAPYGNKHDDDLTARLLSIVRFFEKEQVSAIVVACNTATVVAIDAMRNSTHLSIIGVEPAVKPAFLMSGARHVAVLATPVTVRSLRLNSLVERWKSDCDVSLLSSDTLAFDIDGWPESEDRVTQTVREISEQIQRKSVDTLVLACTHYPLVSSIFKRYLGARCNIIEPSEGVAEEVLRRLKANGFCEQKDAKNTASIVVCSSLSTQNLSQLTAWIDDQSAVTEKKCIAL